MERLGDYGEEAGEFGEVLVLILKGMVRRVEELGGKEVRRFWEEICSFEGGSGVRYYLGWVTAFSFWDSEGGKVKRSGENKGVEARDILGGVTQVSLKIGDNGEEIEAEMLAGSVAILCSSSGRLSVAELDVGSELGTGTEREMVMGLDSMQPQIGWFVYQKKDVAGPVYEWSAAMRQF